MIDIKPGDLVELNCPDATAQPSVVIGQTIPESAPSFLVMKLKDASVTLGPMKAGEFVFDVPCSKGAPIRAELKITPLKAEDLPKAAPPEGLLLLSYPLWFWMMLALLALGISALIVWLNKRYSERFASQARSEQPVEASPEQVFLDFLQSCRRERLSDRSDAASAEFLYSKGQESLRRFLEYRLGFRVTWATSSEFVAQYRSATLSYNELPATVSMVESLLSQADGVRFSKAAPDKPSREAFVRGLDSMAKAIRKALKVSA